MPGSKRSKWINVPLHDDDDASQFPISPPDSHPRNKGRKGANANHLLNFSVERSVARASSHAHSSGRRRYGPTASVPFHSQERFLQSHFQFIVTDDFLHEQEADQSAQWDQLTLVICQEQSIDELSKCPICLDPPVAPKITKCGHIFCWSCLLRMFQASVASASSAKSVTVPGPVEIEVPQRFLQCPLCTEMVGLHALKPVKVLVQPVQYKENDQCQFILLRRHRLSMVMRPAEELAGDHSPPDPHSLPAHNEPAAAFCRFHLDPHHHAIREQLAMELRQLRECSQSADADEGVFLELAVLQTQAHLAFYEDLAVHGAAHPLARSGKRENDHDREEDFQYVYQEQAGQKLFLHPLCSRALLIEYGTLLHAPLRIQSRIMEIEEITIDLETRKRYKFLAHLPLSTQVGICEIDMRSLVSRTSLEPLLPKIHKRIHARKKRQQSEQKAEERWRRSQQQEFQASAPIDVDFSDFVPLTSPSGEDAAFSFSPPAQVQPPQWNIDRSYRPPPRQLMSRPTQVRRVRGSDGESDEELAAPSFSSSFYESISLDFTPPEVSTHTTGAPEAEEGPGRKGKKRKQQRKKQLLFSSYN